MLAHGLLLKALGERGVALQMAFALPQAQTLVLGLSLVDKAHSKTSKESLSHYMG